MSEMFYGKHGKHLTLAEAGQWLIGGLMLLVPFAIIFLR